MKLNSKQREHITDALRTMSLGQFGVFGYTGIQTHRTVWIVGSAIIAVVLELVAVFMLRHEKEKADA